MPGAHITARVRLLSGVVIFLALVTGARLYQLQIVEGAEYQALAEGQYVRTTNDGFQRGSIFFTSRTGELLSAASVRSGFTIAVNPTQVTDAGRLCEALTPIVPIERSLCETRATLPDRVYVELYDQADDAMVESVRALAPVGVQIIRNRWRYYPGGSVAARSIGFVGFVDDGTAMRGKYGLERQYDDVLYRDQTAVKVNYFAELFSNLGDYFYRRNDMAAGDIVTTLEPSVSRYLDTVLEEVQQQYSSELTGAIIMDPQTGAIYAMNAVPSFDLNDRQVEDIAQYRNPLVEDVYEFGSTIKALTVAAGLDAGAITPESTYYDAGSIELDTLTIRNYDGKGRGTVAMQAVLNQSLNTGVAEIVQRMGKESFRDYFLAYKLGSESGIDLPNETYGLVNNLYSPRDVEYATASFGQGIAMTPIAAARALATLGNGGKLVTPHLVREIRYADGTVKPIRYPEGEQVLRPETSEEISRMLVKVVDEALLNGTVSIKTHTIGAKTGTAQIPDAENGGYYEDRFLHSFFGYFPAFEPRFIVFLYTVEPKGVWYASETLTEPFMDIAKFLINYYSIPPDR